MSEICTLEETGPDSLALVGGKACNLGRLLRAGLPVPPGFCVSSAAQKRLQGYSPHEDSSFRDAVISAYRKLGSTPVAVRSSAGGEDGQLHSFAGQHLTVLGVSDEAALLDAIARCWASLTSERAAAYRQQQGANQQPVGMAVIVQRLIDAEVAGVLFTRDPVAPDARRMLVEASWGLGESVVSGRMTPDRFTLDHESGTVLRQQIQTKADQLTRDGWQGVSPEKQDRPCLNDTQLGELARLGRQVEELYGSPQDIEWAWADGRFWLLQARPITTDGASERERVRREEIATLQARAEPGGTVWSRYNLAEILPAPTPMTWAIVRRFLSGRGGLGLMYRDLGSIPDPALDEEGIFDLVCGRPYCNLRREPRLQFHGLPFEHPFATLKADPRQALYPRPVFNPSRVGWRFWLRLPAILVRTARAAARASELSRNFPRSFLEEVAPAFERAVQTEAQRDLSRLSTEELVQRLEEWIRRTLIDFARDSLKPTALAALSLGRLEQALGGSLGPERTRSALNELGQGATPQPEADLAAAIRGLAAGRMQQSLFLERFGQRGPQEMELAQPRWSEDPAALSRLLQQLEQTPRADRKNAPDATTDQRWTRIAAEARLKPRQRTALWTEVQNLRLYLGLRETAKHYLMMGYSLLRATLVELDRRHGLNGGIFFLTPDELPQLADGRDWLATIASRRRRRALALGLEVPAVLFSDDLEAIGRPVVSSAKALFQGVPVSSGVATGSALLLTEPRTDQLPTEPFILVCPSTDPAWVPLFVRAAGLVMETGGMLSHGAIVAREFGLAAVAGVPGILEQVRTGQPLRVDGEAGTVAILSTEGSTVAAVLPRR
jgi:pyruvate,water dikinase